MLRIALKLKIISHLIVGTRNNRYLHSGSTRELTYSLCHSPVVKASHTKCWSREFESTFSDRGIPNDLHLNGLEFNQQSRGVGASGRAHTPSTYHRGPWFISGNG